MSSGCRFKNQVIQFLPTVDSSSHSFLLSNATASLTCAILGGNLHSSSFRIYRTIAFSSAGIHSCREIFALDRDCPPFRCQCRVVYPTPKASAVFRIEEYCPFSYANTARRIVLSRWVSMVRWRCLSLPIMLYSYLFAITLINCMARNETTYRI